MTYTNAELARHLNVAPPIITLWRRKNPPIPNDSLDAAERWRMLNAPARGKRVAKLALAAQEATTATTSTSTAPATDSSWPARLERCRKVELQIFDTLQKALSSGDLISLQKLQSSHVGAIKELAAAELVALEVQKQSRDLIPIDEVRTMMAGILGPVRRELDRMPLTLRSRCNPADPELAGKALQAWSDRALTIIRNDIEKFFNESEAADDSQAES